MIYQVKIDQAVLFTGTELDVIDYLYKPNRYPIEWLTVYGYEMGEQHEVLPYKEDAKNFIQ